MLIFAGNILFKNVFISDEITMLGCKVEHPLSLHFEAVAEVERRAWAEDAVMQSCLVMRSLPGLSTSIYHLLPWWSMGSWYQPSMAENTMHFTPTEHRLLTCLVRNEGRVVSHKELLEAMSSGNSGNSIGSLRTYICRLRQKVEVDPALPEVIITHYFQGCSFAGKEEARWFPEEEGQ